MAPNRGTTKASSKGKVSSKASKPLSSASKVTKSKAKSKSKQPPAKEVKSKPNNAADQAKKNKKPEYSEEELGLMPLNMVTPVGVQKPKGKKKNKVFVDDQESMMAILNMVNAEKEGQIESKLMRARQLEEIREARRKEAEARAEQKKSKLEGIKAELREKKKKKKKQQQTGSEQASNGTKQSEQAEEKSEESSKQNKKRKRVSFA
ncbi:hypothetical protein VTN49DRAFT_3645 [Thermomyces lanuginosus]|uniref:uncharacterized protein n=1 Tax=Thermomyces lanuginosus TaxID=5541 RepID=UPI0037442051